MMTTKERFYRVCNWEKPDQVPNVEFGYWEETIAAWHQQGLPLELKTHQDIERYLGLEGTETFPRLPINNWLYPGFERKVLEEGADYLIVQTEEGNICKVFKYRASMPQYIKYGLETRRDWEIYKREQLDYTLPERLGDIQQAVAEAKASGKPLVIFAGALYGLLRNCMGLENISLAIMTERDWVEEMMEHLTEMTLYLIEKALPGIEVDIGWWWEDMCYNHGPLLSPKIFEELMVPRYKRITEALHKYGVYVNLVDCDGKIYELVSGWLKGGINCMFPLEAAHTDLFKLREKYGKELILVGGVNKVEIAKGKDAIDRELERLQPLVGRGGYIPCFDHRVPPDVSFENYCYYLEKKKQIL